ncbi:MAG: hypothetical protein WDM92_08480 [Caulobacteraceae bacterium]
MDIETRAELLTLRAFLLLTIAQLANSQPDPDRLLAEMREELVRALGAVRIEPVMLQAAVRARAVEFAEDWFTHIHFKDGDTPPPSYAER